MKPSDLELLKRKFPLSAATLERNTENRPAELPAQKPEHNSGQSLDRPVSGKETSCPSYYVEYHIYALQPPDFDNAFTKPIQDCFVTAGLIPNDDWQTLGGRIFPHKVERKEDQRTEIILTHEEVH